ncbi:hypothetical protein JCM18901_1473 [Psychrobacter sp. JCM 18901]|nr:hypothetical protein JCM18901_1473 [Psychrobacter sp. JCM 18901]
MRYQSSSPKRRFLAGVRCPKCQEMDAVVQVNIVTPAQMSILNVLSADTQSTVLTLMPLVLRTI